MATMNPATTSRRDFTTSLTSHPVPESADPKYENLATSLRKLLELLVNHEAMSTNISQTYSTPAASKNKVYFMWDFVGRTLAMLYAVPSTMPSNIDRNDAIPVNKQKAAWNEVLGRSIYARELILDDGGKLDAMMNISYGDGSGVDRAEFGDEVLQAARAVMENE